MKLFEKALNELKIPKDFNNIHSVSDLLQIKNFGDDINTFFENYLEEWYTSFKMNMDEVLDYIPESELKDYKFAPGYEFIFCNITYYIIKDTLKDDFLKENNNLKHYHDNIYIGGHNIYENNIIDNLNFVNNKDKVYFVDNKKKTIHVCLDDLSKFSVLRKNEYGSAVISYRANNKFDNNYYHKDYIITLHVLMYELNLTRTFKLYVQNKFNLDINEYESDLLNFNLDINVNDLLKLYSNKKEINEVNFNEYLCKKN